jgi:hypothetical protein
MRLTARWSNAAIWLALACGELHAQQQPIPADIGVTMTATPSSGLRTGSVVDIALTATNYGPESADYLDLDSSYFYHEFDITHIDAVACHQFGGSTADGVHPVFMVFWIVGGLPGVYMQPLAVGESRTCHFQLTLMADAPPVTAFTFRVSTYFSDINASNDSATVYLTRAIPTTPSLGVTTMLLLAATILATGAVAISRRG